MKAKSKLLILLLTLALLSGILAVTASAEDTTGTETEPTTGFGVTVNGETTDYTDKTTYAALVSYVNDMTSPAKITLYQDYEDESPYRILTFQKDGTELDLNGHSITLIGKNCNIRSSDCSGKGVFIYSSKPNAKILATNERTKETVNNKQIDLGGGFIFQAKGNLTIGRAPNGSVTNPYKGNLTIKGTTLIDVYDDVVLDGILYENSIGDNCGCIQFDNAEAAVEIKDCELYVQTNSLFGLRINNAHTATVTGSKIYTSVSNNRLVDVHSKFATDSKGESYNGTKQEPGATFENTAICSKNELLNTYVNLFPIKLGEGVTMSFANTGLTTTDTALIVARTDETAVTINDKEYKTSYKVVPSTAKEFEVTIDGTTTYYTDTTFATLRAVVDDLTHPAKIKLYRGYEFPENGVLEFDYKDVAGSELDLNGQTLTKKYKSSVLISATYDLYVYSTAEGAKLLANTDRKEENGIKYGGGVMLKAYGGSMVVGRAPDSTITYPLTAEGTTLLIVYKTGNVELSNLTGIQSIGDNFGYLQFNGTSGSALTVNACDFYLSNLALFGLREGEGWKAEVKNSRIYAGSRSLVDFHTDAGTGTGVTFTDTVICSETALTSCEKFPIKLGKGVKTNYPNDLSLVTSVEETLVFAHTDATKITLNENDFTLLYEVVADANAVKVIFKGGNTELATQLWKKESTPSEYKADAFADSSYYWYVKPTAPVNEATTYPATLKTTESKITGNLTLYANITFNLYFKNDGFIKGVTYTHPVTGTTTTANFTEQEPVTINGESYYLFKIDNISPKDLSEALTLEVLLENGDATATYTVKTSLSKYAASVLANEATDDKTEAGKTLVLALLDYVREMSVTLGEKTESDDGIKAIDAGLKKYKSAYIRKTWSKTGVKIPDSGNITGASLMLTSTPGFVFYLNSTEYATAETVEVTVNGTETSYTVTHEGDNHYFIVSNIHVSKYNDALTVKLGEQSFEYSLDVYMQGFIENKKEIPAYANALYSYVLAAKAYLEAQGN